MQAISANDGQQPPISNDQPALTPEQPLHAHDQAPVAHEQPHPARPTGSITRRLQARAETREGHKRLQQQISESEARLQEHASLIQDVRDLVQASRQHELCYGEKPKAAEKIQVLHQPCNALGERLACRERELRLRLPRQSEQAEYGTPELGHAVTATQHTGHDESLLVYNVVLPSPPYERREIRDQGSHTAPHNARPCGYVEPPREYPLEPLYGTDEYWKQEGLHGYLKYVHPFRFATPKEDHPAECPFVFPESWLREKYSDEIPEFLSDVFFKFIAQFTFLNIVDPHRFPPRYKDSDQLENRTNVTVHSAIIEEQLRALDPAVFQQPVSKVLAQLECLKGYLPSKVSWYGVKRYWAPRHPIAFLNRFYRYGVAPRNADIDELQSHTNAAVRWLTMEEVLQELGYGPGEYHTSEAQMAIFQAISPFLPIPRHGDYENQQHTEPFPRLPSKEQQLREVSLTQLQELRENARIEGPVGYRSPYNISPAIPRMLHDPHRFSPQSEDPEELSGPTDACAHLPTSGEQEKSAAAGCPFPRGCVPLVCVFCSWQRSCSDPQHDADGEDEGYCSDSTWSEALDEEDIERYSQAMLIEVTEAQAEWRRSRETDQVLFAPANARPRVLLPPVPTAANARQSVFVPLIDYGDEDKENKPPQEDQFDDDFDE